MSKVSGWMKANRGVEEMDRIGKGDKGKPHRKRDTVIRRKCMHAIVYLRCHVLKCRR